MPAPAAAAVDDSIEESRRRERQAISRQQFTLVPVPPVPRAYGDDDLFKLQISVTGRLISIVGEAARDMRVDEMLDEVRRRLALM